MEDQDVSDGSDSDWDRLSAAARGNYDEVEAPLIVAPSVAPGQPADFLGPQAITSNKESQEAPSPTRSKKKYKKKTQLNPPVRNVDRYGFKIPENQWKDQRKGIKCKAQKKYEKKVRDHEHNLQQSKGAHGANAGKETPQNGRRGEHGGIPAAKPQAFESDESIPEHDLYREKGCERRMVFRTDPVPLDLQYKVQKHTELSAVVENLAENALSKFLKWCRTRPTSDMRMKTPETFDEEAFEDSKKPRHFVLIMGPPDGPYGDADRLAAQLESAYKQFLKMRLQNSHVTIETEIPYIKLTGTGYFAKYLEALLSLKDPKKLGDRLNIKLAEKPTKHLLCAGPELFYDEPVDVEAAWQRALYCMKPNLFIMTCIPGKEFGYLGPGQDLDTPDPAEVEKAKSYFAMHKQDEVVKRKEYIAAALGDTKALIESILRPAREKTPAVVAKAITIVSEENAPESMAVHNRSPQQMFEPPSKSRKVPEDIIDLTGDTNSSKSVKHGAELGTAVHISTSRASMRPRATGLEGTQVLSMSSDPTAVWVEQQRFYAPFYENVGLPFPSLHFRDSKEGDQGGRSSPNV
jgi:hypothetical protein